MKLGLLGPEGTFSETAALLWLKMRTTGTAEPAELRFYATIFDVADSVARGEVAYGVVPIENSLEGSVGETLDVLTSESTAGAVRIVGEVLVPIRICLLARGTFAQIRTVVSHPHAIAQCKRYIRERLLSRGVKVEAVDSTAAAAKLAKEMDAIAALASEEAARRYQLAILAENVQDKASVTRFVALAPAGVQTTPTGHDKTSLLLALKDRPGALYEVLGVFAERGINLTKIESRPSKRALGDYMFHIDCEGHVEEKEIKAVLANLASQVTMIKLLGSYPEAE